MKRDLDDLANDLKMNRSVNKKIAYLIVEGEKDRKVFENIVDPNNIRPINCWIIPAEGKENAIKLLSKLEIRKCDGVLVIIDADFWHLDGLPFKNSNIKLTDTHDLETMIIKSPALEKVLVEYTDKRRLNNFDQSIREFIIKNGKKIGYLRWYCAKKGLKLSFKKLSFNDYKNCTDFKTLDIKVNDFISLILSQSTNCNLKDDELICELEDIVKKNPNIDPWQICSGHDLIKILLIGLHHAFGSHNSMKLNHHALEGALRVAYELRFFFETKLYKSILNWESKNNPFIILVEKKKNNF